MPFSVMAGLVPAIQVVRLTRARMVADPLPTVYETVARADDMDGRDKPGHDGRGRQRSRRPFNPSGSAEGVRNSPGGRVQCAQGRHAGEGAAGPTPRR